MNSYISLVFNLPGREDGIGIGVGIDVGVGAGVGVTIPI